MDAKNYPSVNNVTLYDTTNTPVGTIDAIKNNSKFYKYDFAGTVDESDPEQISKLNLNYRKLIEDMETMFLNRVKLEEKVS